MKQIFKTGLFLFAGVIILTGCKKNSGNALLTLRLHSYIGTDSIVSGTTYANSRGRNVSFNRMEYYLSNIQLTATDGSLVPVSGIALVNSNTLDYTLGNIAIGSYKSISFDVGLVSNNHDDPATHSGADPLSAQTPSMHFANDSLGYIFMAVEGLEDSSAGGTGTPNKPFSYHIGTDTYLKAVSLGDHSITPYSAYTASSGKIMVVDLIADFGALTKNIDMNVHSITNTSDYPAVADSLANNIPAMFRYKQ